jgi:TldD protein
MAFLCTIISVRPGENVTTDIDYEKILHSATAGGGEFADVFVERGNSFAIVCENSAVEKIVSGTDCGAGVRLVRDSRSAYAYTNELTTDSLARAADAVRWTAGDAARPASVVSSQRGPGPAVSVARDPRGVDAKRKAGMVLEAERAARAIDSRIRQVLVTYREYCQRVVLVSSDGIFREDERMYLTAFAHVVAASGNVVQTGYESVGGNAGMELFDNDALLRAAETAARRAAMLLTARKAPAGRMPVVLSSRAGGTMVHEAIGHGLEADLAQSGLSVYSNRINEMIASPLITVVDDATLPGRRGSFQIDDEGMPAERTVLVDRGVLKTFLYDRLTASKDNARSTGNGRRESYKHRPIPRMSNTMIAPGEADAESILRETAKGLFVTRMGGGQVNTVTGDFVFEVSEGFLIDGGAVGEPVRGATLIGNGPSVLQAVDRVGSDLGFSIGTCGKDGQGSPVSDAQPTIRIPEITVGGEA